MKIIIMRHGEAEHSAPSDAERALTEKGRAVSCEIAGRLVKQQGIGSLDKVLVSPYLRAQQTWQAIAQCFTTNQVETCDDISPYGQADDVVEYIAALVETENLQTVLVVSHLPLVGYLVAEMVADVPAPMFPTSGIVGIEFDPETRQASLLWSLYP